jgi:hypothetical protein
MAQLAVPNSIVSATWVGTVAGLTDASDSTYLESPADPTAASTFLCSLSSIADPLIHTAHQLRVRTALYPSTGAALSLALSLENADDSSVVASWTVVAPVAVAESVLSISEAQAALIHSYSGLRVRGYAEAASYTYFVWSAVGGATSYVLQIRPSTSATYDTYNADVGNVLTYGVALASATYYSRVVPYVGGTALTPTAEQAVTV